MDQNTLGLFMIGGVILLIFVSISIYIVYLSKQYKLRANTWNTTKGVYHHVEYGFHNQRETHGSMVHHTEYRRIEHTIIYFDDGRTVVLNGRYNIPCKAGTHMTIKVNGNNKAWIFGI